MVEARVTKIVCPSCDGTGKFLSLDFACMWCGGAIRLPVPRAYQYADQLYMIAGGGFIAGDHDYKHKVEMEHRAESIYRLGGGTAPWRDAAGRSALSKEPGDG